MSLISTIHHFVEILAFRTKLVIKTSNDTKTTQDFVLTILAFLTIYQYLLYVTPFFSTACQQTL